MTYLDTIVDEETAGNLIRVPNGVEIGTFSEKVMGQIHRIAERAFRHGVEQAERACVGVSGAHFVRWEGVQPGPAGEKPGGCPHRWSGRGTCLGAEGHDGHHMFFDRRKGQRRKGLEVKATTGAGTHVWGGQNPWQKERRDGMDRRRG